MANIKNLTPFKVFGPGYFIQEQMELRNWTQEDLAAVLGMSEKSINQLLQNKQSITLDSARLLSSAFGQSANYWMNLDTNYRLHQQVETEKEKAVKIKSPIFEFMPINEMFKKGWLQKTKEVDQLEKQVMDFWGTKSMDFSKIHEECIPADFKKSEAHAQFSKNAANCWIQMAKNCAKKMDLAKYEKKKLEILFNEMHKYTVKKDGVAEFLKELNKTGVKFFHLSHLQKTYIDGAAFLDDKHPVIVYTGRYKRTDNFWFTMAHEIAHVLKHIKSKDDCFLDDTHSKAENIDKKEAEANSLASEKLKHKEIVEFLKDSLNYLTRENITQCSEELQINEGIIIGALAFSKTISYSHLHEFNENPLDKIPVKFFAEKNLLN
jgi:HTH-type transcriptional regulator / antitoxin HigA